MKPTANFGAGAPFLTDPDGPPFSEDDAAEIDEVLLPEGADHDPDATALLKRYLAEIHGFREMGNQALRNLEARLATRPGDDEEGEEPAPSQARAPSQLIKPSLAKAEEKPRDPEPSLTQRLNELSAYLHANLAHGADEPVETAAPAPQIQAPAPEPVQPQMQAPAQVPSRPQTPPPTPQRMQPQVQVRAQHQGRPEVRVRIPQQVRAQPQIQVRAPQPAQVHVSPATQPRVTPAAQPQPQVQTRAPQVAQPEPPMQARVSEQQASASQPEAVQQPQPQHKPPSAPVLDRAWFEERFAALRTSIEKVAEEIPLKRVEALEAQFRNLMDRLAAREDARDPRPMETSLKQLASYLADNRQWQAASDRRMKGVEDRLDRLSDLVAQSNAAISATADGLEIIAKGTGENLVRATAGAVIAKLGEQIERTNPAARLDQLGQQVAQLAQNDQTTRLDQLAQFVARLAQNDPAKRLDAIGQQVALIAQNNPAERLEQLGREVAHLSAQSRINSRGTEDRLGQIEIVLKEKVKPAPGSTQPRRKLDPAERSSHDELESYLNRQPANSDDDYDSDMIAAAQRAARLADGPSRSASPRGGARHQIPYGDFLPDDDSPASRAGLIIAVAILLLAGAIMAFVKVKEWTLSEPKPAAMLERQPGGMTSSVDKSSRQPRASLDMEVLGTPIVTGSTPAAPPLNGKQMQLWVAARAPDTAAPAATPGVQPSSDPSFRQAAVQGDVKAQYSVGQSYLAGADGDTELSDGDRLSAAARWFRRAAEAGHAPSQFRLAKLYELGRGAPRDVAEAEKWHGRAAAQGHVNAMHSLAMLAAAHNRRSTNYLTAAKWFAEAASYGLIEAQFNFGILCENGLGTAKNLEDAYFWYALAAKQRDPKAAVKRGEIGKLLSQTERQIVERRIAAWTPKRRSEEVNSIAPEPPVAMGRDDKPALPNPAPTTSTAVMRASWKGEITTTVKTSGAPAMIAEAQRLLIQRGYQPGPVDGAAGPRTQAAIRSFQARSGLAQTGEVSEELIVKMAFLPL
jgi:TPR repeat protein